MTGPAAIAGIVGVCVAVISTAASIGTSVSQAKKAENRMKQQEHKAEMLMRKKGNMMVIKAMTSAAANSTATRVERDISEKKLGYLVAMNGEGQYKLSKESAKEAQAKLDNFYKNHDYGAPASPIDPTGPVSGTSG